MTTTSVSRESHLFEGPGRQCGQGSDITGLSPVHIKSVPDSTVTSSSVRCQCAGIPMHHRCSVNRFPDYLVPTATCTMKLALNSSLALSASRSSSKVRAVASSISAP